MIESRFGKGYLRFPPMLVRDDVFLLFLSSGSLRSARDGPGETHSGNPRRRRAGDTARILFDGRTRSHHWDRLTAQIAAEKLADDLTKANYVIMRGPPEPAHTMHTAWKPPTKD